jgi:hypothetical protein
MKKLILIVLMVPVVAFGQKALKPNTGKILSLYQDGKYKEAKEQADVTIAGEKTATDGKAWYYRGLVYATLDTIKDESLNSLDPNPLKVAVESFQKAEEYNKKKDSEYFITAKGDFLPIQKSNQLMMLSNYYLDKGIKLMQQDEPDYADSYAKSAQARYVFENTLTKYDNDTLTYYVLALAALNMQHYDSAAEAARKYIDKGAKGVEAYLILIQAYGEKKDDAKLLATIKEARQKFPANDDLTKSELNFYITNEQYDVAKKMVGEMLKADPSAQNYYLLGALNRELKNMPEAMEAYKETLKRDANHFDANAGMAELTYALVQEIRNKRNETNDTEKRRQLYAQIEQKLKESLPYWERLEAIKPNEETVLYGLQSIYNDLTTYEEAKYTAKLNKLKGKMKALGLEVD